MTSKKRIFELLTKEYIVSNWNDDLTDESIENLIKSLCPDKNYNDIVEFLESNDYYDEILNYRIKPTYDGVTDKQIIHYYLKEQLWDGLDNIQDYYHQLIKKEVKLLAEANKDMPSKFAKSILDKWINLCYHDDAGIWDVETLFRSMSISINYENNTKFDELVKCSGFELQWEFDGYDGEYIKSLNDYEAVYDEFATLIKQDINYQESDNNDY